MAGGHELRPTLLGHLQLQRRPRRTTPTTRTTTTATTTVVTTAVSNTLFGLVIMFLLDGSASEGSDRGGAGTGTGTGIGQAWAAASALTACNHTTLLERIPHIAPFEGVFNGESVRLECDEGYQPAIGGGGTGGVGVGGRAGSFTGAGIFPSSSSSSLSLSLSASASASTTATCERGEWTLPATEFRCLPEGFCRLSVRTGPSVKVIHSSHEKRLRFGQDIFADAESVLIKCRSDNTTHTFTCRRGEWSPQDRLPCRVPVCPPLPALDNGVFSPASHEVAEPICNAGHHRKGSASIYCHGGKWAVKRFDTWPTCERLEVLRTPSSPLAKYQWIAVAAGAVLLLVVVVLLAAWWCYAHLRRCESSKRNRLMHQTSHVDELLHLRRTKPIVIPETIAHTQVHYTYDRKPIPVTSL